MRCSRIEDAGDRSMTELSGSRKAPDALKLEATTDHFDQFSYQSPVSMFVLISKAVYRICKPVHAGQVRT